MKELIQQLFEVRSQITEIKERQLKDLEAQKKELEAQVFQALEDAGVVATTLKGTGSVSITEQVVPQAEDWDAFYEYVLEDKMRFMLLNKALNAPAFREALNIEGEIPGLTPFTKRTLSVRKAA